SALMLTRPAPPQIYTLSLHDALPIYLRRSTPERSHRENGNEEGLVAFSLRRGLIGGRRRCERAAGRSAGDPGRNTGGRVRSVGSDRKSTRLNSSHVKISYAVFCLQKK